MARLLPAASRQVYSAHQEQSAEQKVERKQTKKACSPVGTTSMMPRLCKTSFLKRLTSIKSQLLCTGTTEHQESVSGISQTSFSAGLFEDFPLSREALGFSAHTGLPTKLGFISLCTSAWAFKGCGSHGPKLSTQADGWPWFYGCLESQSHQITEASIQISRKAQEARKCVAGSRCLQVLPEKTVHKAAKVKPKIPQRLQEGEDVRGVDIHLQR